MHLRNWLEIELSGWRLITFPTALLTGFLVYSSVFLNIFDALGFNMPNSNVFNPQHYMNEYIVMHLMFVSIVEEFTCRLIPLFIAVRLKHNWILYGTIIISSMVFGYIHGSVLNILYQGVAGIALSIIYLKSGGMNKKVFKPYMVCIAAHASYNFFTSMVG